MELEQNHPKQLKKEWDVAYVYNILCKDIKTRQSVLAFNELLPYSHYMKPPRVDSHVIKIYRSHFTSGSFLPTGMPEHIQSLIDYAIKQGCYVQAKISNTGNGVNFVVLCKTGLRRGFQMEKAIVDKTENAEAGLTEYFNDETLR